MKIVYLDTFALGGIDLTPISSLGDFTAYHDTLQADAVERSIDADVVITNKVKFFRDEIDSLPKLKLICVSATGTNNVDIEYANSHAIEVKNVSGYSTASVTEATFGMVLTLMRNIGFYDNFVKSGEYSASGKWFSLGKPINDISSKRWGVIGMGNIGQNVARIAEAFGATVSYYSTSGNNTSCGYPSLSLEELLKTSDIVSIHAPLNAATKNLIDYNKIKLMKPDAILINVGRGKIVNESDLALALNEGLIAGAGLDVFAKEPIESENPLLNITNPHKIVLASHTAWASEQARKVLVDGVADNIRTYYQL